MTVFCSGAGWRNFKRVIVKVGKWSRAVSFCNVDDVACNKYQLADPLSNMSFIFQLFPSTTEMAVLSNRFRSINRSASDPLKK